MNLNLGRVRRRRRKSRKKRRKARRKIKESIFWKFRK